jgi:hypothetical protein
MYMAFEGGVIIREHKHVWEDKELSDEVYGDCKPRTTRKC